MCVFLINYELSYVYKFDDDFSSSDIVRKFPSVREEDLDIEWIVPARTESKKKESFYFWWWGYSSLLVRWLTLLYYLSLWI